MKETKFKVWNKKTKTMSAPRHIQELICVDKLCMIEMLSCEFLQYTGLKDKSDMEIYEGDIVSILYTDWPSQAPEVNGKFAMTLDEYMDSMSNTGKVVFSDCEYCIQFNDDGYTNSIHCGAHGQIKVIGSIYENPELLLQPTETKDDEC